MKPYQKWVFPAPSCCDVWQKPTQSSSTSFSQFPAIYLKTPSIDLSSYSKEITLQSWRKMTDLVAQFSKSQKEAGRTLPKAVFLIQRPDQTWTPSTCPCHFSALSARMSRTRAIKPYWNCHLQPSQRHMYKFVHLYPSITETYAN